MKNAVLVFALLISVSGFSQPRFNRDYNSPGQACGSATQVKTQDGGIALLAHMFDISGPTQAAVVYRTDAVGNLQWETHISLSATIQNLSNIVRSPDSSYFFASYEFGGSFNIYRVDASGAVIFGNCITVPAPFYNLSTPVCYARNDGTFLVIGTIYNQSSGEYFWTMMSIDHNGGIVWSKIFNRNMTKVYHHDLDTTANGDIILLGEWIDTTNIATGPCLSRITSTGTLLWTKSWTSSTTTLLPQEVNVMPGDFIFVSSVRMNTITGNWETAVSRFTAQGNEIWTMLYSANNLYPRDIIAAGEHLLVLGESMYDGFLFEIDSTGIPIWGKNYDNNWPMDIEYSTVCGYTITSSSQINGMRVYTADLYGGTCLDSSIDVVKTPVTMMPLYPGSDSVITYSVSQAIYSVLSNPSVVATNCFQSSVEEQESEPAVTVYPNPTTDLITIRSDQRIETVEISDIRGRSIIHERFENSNNQMDVSTLVPGCYIIHIYHENHVESQRLIIE